MEEASHQSNVFMGMSAKLRDVEEKQQILRDRMILIGQNLIESKEKTSEDIIEIKKEIEMLKDTLKKFHSLLESMSEEMSKFARKDDLEILSKQAKMFQPLEFVTKAELKNLT